MMDLLRQVGLGGVEYSGKGIDQGAHNYLLYLQQHALGGTTVVFLSNEEGAIFNNVCWEGGGSKCFKSYLHACVRSC